VSPFSPIHEVLDDLRAGKMVILTDDESRENEGDLVLPTQFCTPQAITFMLTHARGYLCVSMTESDCDRLDLSPQAAVNTSKRGTAFTVSLDGHPRHGFTTGVSAAERSRCMKMMIDPAFNAGDFVRPGHINPLRSRNGGTLVRTGQTEGSLDLCRLSGLYPSALIIEIMKDDGEMARVPDLVTFARQHNIKMCSVAQIIEYRLARESLVRRIGSPRPILTPWGEFQAHVFESVVDPLPHLALTVGPVGLPGTEEHSPTLVRMHRRNLLGDVFHDLRSGTDGSTGQQLHAAMARIQQEGRGAIVYLRTTEPASKDPATGVDLEGELQRLRGTFDGNVNSETDAPTLTGSAGQEAMPAAHREFGIGVQILRSLGLSKITLLSNHKRELPGLDAFGIEIVGHEPLTAIHKPAVIS
jgi:3,4-dihydroxy 2-butanone 4-phosphate synthase/GTP cyclohydrolase II